MFKKAEKSKSKLRLALDGASGSGKTTAALTIATGMGGRIAVIDTENNSASLYSDLFEFDALNLEPPFSPERYIEAIKAAEQEGYDVVIIDSMSHEWAGMGGCLHILEELGGKGTAWKKITPRHNAFLNAIIYSGIHIIGTLRSKTEYAFAQEQGQKATMTKLGASPVQRDQFEYEFTVQLSLNQNHIASASKDRTRLFDGKDFKITEETGRQLLEWLNTGVELATPEQLKAIQALISEKKVTREMVNEWFSATNTKKLSDIPANKMAEFIAGVAA